jgi:hypothetical protein
LEFPSAIFLQFQVHSIDFSGIPAVAHSLLPGHFHYVSQNLIRTHTMRAKLEERELVK